MSQEEVSLKLAQLLDEFSRGEVHCVVLAAASAHESKSIAFGMEMNTRRDVAAALLQAGIGRLDDMRLDDGKPAALRPGHAGH